MPWLTVYSKIKRRRSQTHRQKILPTAMWKTQLPPVQRLRRRMKKSLNRTPMLRPLKHWSQRRLLFDRPRATAWTFPSQKRSIAASNRRCGGRTGRPTLRRTVRRAIKAMKVIRASTAPWSRWKKTRAIPTPVKRVKRARLVKSAAPSRSAAVAARKIRSACGSKSTPRAWARVDTLSIKLKFWYVTFVGNDTLTRARVFRP